MARRKDQKPPAYRRRRGFSQALVTLTDTATGKRRDYWLGEFGSPESREAYYRLLAEYEACGRRFPSKRVIQRPSDAGDHALDAVTVNDLALEYWRRVARDYMPKRVNAVRPALRLLRRMDGSTPADQYGPKRLRLLREAMIAGDPCATPPRQPWARSTINDRVRIIVAMFRWGVSQEMVPPAVADALGMLEPLKRGRSRAKEPRKVKPVPEFLLEATMPYLPGPVRAMVQLQLLSGARPGEIIHLRGCDIGRDERSGLLAVHLIDHKTADHVGDRTIYFGPGAEAILAPFLRDRSPADFLFSPAEAEAERRARLHARRRTPLSCGNRPGANRVDEPRRPPGKCYSVPSYRRAIQYACERAFPPPEHLRPRVDPESGRRETKAEFRERLSAPEKQELKRWGASHRWHPHQLRHNAATRIRREFGLEAAQLVLGHSSAAITDAVYAERDQSKLTDVISRVG